MLSRAIKLATIILLPFAASLGIIVAGQAHDTTSDTQKKVDSAMSAAPMAVSHDATIVDYETDADGKFIVLQKGTNEWTCWPDWTDSPGNDPMCLDPAFTKWFEAYVAGTDPDITEPGLGYMLQGGSDPSNTDPMAAAPPEGEDWVSAPPHIMVLLPKGADLSQFSTDHNSGKPYVMWAGTPYQHIMMPIAAMEHDQ